jgi:hypothetical protein
MPKNHLTPPVETFWNQVRKDKIGALSVFGSVASIVALAIVVLENISSNLNLSPSQTAWRLIFMGMSFFGIVASGIFTYQWSSVAFKNEQHSPHIRTLIGSLRVIVGALLIGISVDGIYSAVKWTPWLSSAPELIRILWDTLIQPPLVIH